MEFDIRTSAPTNLNKWYASKNPFYNTKYSMFKGHPKLGNCTHYAYGRSSEILNRKSNLPTCDAINWFKKTKYNKGSIPKKGSIICYKHGSSGHVAIVEKIYENGNLLLSMSGWNSYLFKTKEVKKDNNYCYNDYELLGFIYLSNEEEYPILPKRGYFISGDKGDEVKKLQVLLNKVNNASLVVDGIIGKKTINEIKIFQKNNNLKVDGLFGKKSLSKIKNKTI